MSKDVILRNLKQVRGSVGVLKATKSFQKVLADALLECLEVRALDSVEQFHTPVVFDVAVPICSGRSALRRSANDFSGGREEVRDGTVFKFGGAHARHDGSDGL